MARDKSRFAVSFRVSHPTISASDIASHFDMPKGRLFRSVGERYVFPDGKTLGNVNRKTAVGFEIHEKPFSCEDSNVEDVILAQLSEMDLEYTAHLAETGGSCEFFIGIFSEDKNIGVSVDPALSELLARSKISLSFDIYGADY